jgi:putative methanogenesis marker protein 8
MKDIHIVRYFSSLITISDGKVVKVTKPATSGCRMAHFLYDGLKDATALSSGRLKDEIKKIIEDKIARFGFCTKNRMVWKEERSVPYGASEIMAYGLKNKSIDCVVTVCDGVGTVITSVPQIVQGIGARMHTVLKTSFIPEVAVKLRRYGGHILEERGTIDQRAGIIEAAEKGLKRIAVTVNAFGDERLEGIRGIEKELDISATVLVVCTTGIQKDRLIEIEKYADIVWACNSTDVRDRLSEKAIKTLSSISPVYILTEKGEKLISGYMPSVFEMRKEIERSAVL